MRDMTLRTMDPYAKLKYRLRQEGKLVEDKKREFPIENQFMHYELYLDIFPAPEDYDPEFSSFIKLHDLDRRIAARKHTLRYLNDRDDSHEDKFFKRYCKKLFS